MISVPNTSENRVTLAGLREYMSAGTRHHRAETWHHGLKAAAYGAACIGAVTICGAAAMAIQDFGRAGAAEHEAAGARSLLDKASASSLAMMQSAGDSMMALIEKAGVMVRNIDLHGSVEVVPGGEVGIKDGGTVKVTPGAVVGFDQAAPLRVEVTANIPRPTQAELAPDARPQSQADVLTDYTIFKTVPLGSNRRVVTGWHFNEQHKLISQYCYFGEDVDESSEATITIGSNGQFKPPKSFPKNVNLQAAYSNCVWR